MTAPAAATMHFRVLGPVQAFVASKAVDLGERKQRLVLAVLLLEANQLVPVGRLVDLLWPQAPPPSARRIVQTHLSRLRTTLAAVGADAPDIALVRRGSGYLLNCDPRRVDAHQFRTLVDEARWSGTDTEKARLLRSALALWRGPALADAAGDDVREELCRGLHEARLTAVEERLDAELRLGQHARLVDELTDLTTRHPHNQRIAGQLMLALYRTGRVADALRHYTVTRQRLADELGLEPTEELQLLHTAILRAEPSLTPAPAPTEPPAAVPSEPVDPPAQLPADVPDFVGRWAYLRTLDGLLRSAGARSTATPVAIVTGVAGVGKTALATHWAHRRAGEYPDGQLYLNLCAHAARPALTATEALAALLTGLGVEPARIPSRPEDASALYRSRLAGRRVLVVLDDAGSAELVRPLLPGSPTCAALVTSRDRLGGLVACDGARQIALDVLSAAEADDLLVKTVGAERVGQEPAAAAHLARLCGRLPLALRITAANLVVGGHRSVAEYVESVLAGDLMDALQIEGDEGSGVPSAFAGSWAALSEPAGRMFRLLAIMPPTSLPIGAVAALTGMSAPRARRVLGQLVSANLVRRHGSRFAVPELLRSYARSRLVADLNIGVATTALLRWYVEMVANAVRHRDPDALAWLDAERAAFGALVLAADQGPEPARLLAIRLTGLLAGFYRQRGHQAEWARLYAAAAAMADGLRATDQVPWPRRADPVTQI